MLRDLQSSRMAWQGLLYLLLLFIARANAASKLNVPRVLLPFSNEGTSFVLSSDDERACFKWKSSRPEFVAITPLNEDKVKGCSSTAEVTPNSKSWSKAQSIITAEDINSPGHLLRCDVIVDLIHSLQIVTRTHELFLEEAPEEFHVRAYDDQGNEFTTVEKMIFKWNIENVVKKTGSSHHFGDNIRFINFRDSTYAYDESLKKIELSGQQGHKVLLEGIKTGSSKVSVRLASTSGVYAKVSPAEVSVMVVANLYLVPGSAFVMAGATVPYHAEQIKSNKVHIIKLPSHQYLLRVEDGSIGELLKQDAAIVKALALGTTEVTLQDTNLSPDDFIRPPQADLSVVQPSYITLSVNPHKNWNVIVGQEYEIVVDIYDSDNNRIFPSENLVVEIEVDQEYFAVKTRTKNGTTISGIPLQVGETEVKATLKGVEDEYGSILEVEPHLHASGLLEIYDQIVLDPDIAAFPWDPVTHESFSVQFEIEGKIKNTGGPFLWMTGNQSIATVNQSGIGQTVRGASVGETCVRASMKKASHNFGEAKIVILPSVGLKLVNHVLETQVGSELPIPVSMYGMLNGRKQLFSQCQNLPLSVNVSDSKVFSDHTQGSKSDMEETCAMVQLQASTEGFSNVKVSYAYPSHGKTAQLSDETMVSAFKSLEPVQPDSGETLIAIGSSLQLVWTGGPLPWVKKPESHFSRVEISDNSIADFGDRISIKGSPGLFVYEVHCKTQGETKATIYVGNRKSYTLPNPVVASSTVIIRCDRPASIELTPEIPRPVDTKKPCPLNAKTGRIAALAYEPLLLKVALYDEKGRKFDNISSIDVDWKLNDNSHGSLKKKTGVEYLPEKKLSGYKTVQDAYQTFQVNGKTGTIEISAKLPKTAVLGFGAIEESLKLNLVNDASVEPASISVFNHPDNRDSIEVSGGSGFFEIVPAPGTSNEQLVAESQFFPSNESILIRPLNDGDLSISVRDICLKAKKSPVVKVSVSGVDRVELVMNDKVQLGRSISAHVRLLDRHGHQLAPSALRFLNVRPVSASNIVKIQRDETVPLEDLKFIVSGEHLGETSITARVRFGAQSSSSSTQSIQVFPPLEIEPKNITLIIGAKFQVKTIGGPRPEGSIEYLLENSRVADSNSVGLIEAKTLGNTKLIARSVGMDRLTGNKVVFSSDEVTVYVVKLHDIRIHTPITRIHVGSTMPVWAMGTDEHQNPYSFGSAIPVLDFKWSIDNKDAGLLVSPFYANTMISSPKENNGIMRFIAKKPGRVVIKLRAKVTKTLIGDLFQFHRDQEFVHQIQLQVFDDLELTAPGHIPRAGLLMTPNSAFQLRTNREGLGKITYSVLTEPGSNERAVTVSKSGKVVAGSNVGSATILIEDAEDFGVVQKMTVIVDVKNIHYMMLNVDPTFLPNPKVQNSQQLPKGLTLPMTVSYHDNAGLIFDVTDADTQYRPSRFDSLVILEDRNDSIKAELVREEFTVLKVDSGLKGREDLKDYVIINVGGGILPDIPQAVTVGTVIAFENLIIDAHEDSRNGQWVSEPKGMIDVNPENGMATVLRPGQARVSFFLGAEEQRITTDLEIKPAAKITLAAPHLLTRTPGIQFVTFLVQSESGSESSNFISGPSFTSADMTTPSSLFECTARFIDGSTHNFQDFYSVEARFNFEKESYGCQLTPKEEIFAPKSSLVSGEVEMAVIALQHSSKQIVKEARTRFRFISGFHVVIHRLDLSNSEPQGEVGIQGLSMVLDTVTLESSDESYVLVQRGYKAEEQIKIFPVHLKSGYWNDVPKIREIYLTARSSLTNESVDIPVVIHFSPDYCTQGELTWMSLLRFIIDNLQAIIFTAALGAFIYYYARNTALKSKTANAAASSASGLASALSDASRYIDPNRSPSSSSNRSSVTSPANMMSSQNKPFLWTTDSSPVYGSPTVRRSPPSNQYSYS